MTLSFAERYLGDAIAILEPDLDERTTTPALTRTQKEDDREPLF